jgi:integrase/recombinase XerC
VKAGKGEGAAGRILDAMRRYPRLRLMYLRDAAIVNLILFAGLRVGEIIQLRKSDINLDERKGRVIVRKGKGIKRREIPLNNKVRKAMRDYLQVRPEIEINHLFLGQRNEGIKSKTVQRSVTRFTDPIGMRDVTPHTLRHTFAKSLIDSWVGLEKVATLLGHSNLNTTRIYKTPGAQDLEDAVSGLEYFYILVSCRRDGMLKITTQELRTEPIKIHPTHVV